MEGIETARLRLRMFTPGDLDDLYPIFSDPDVVKYMNKGEPASREETEYALTSIINHWQQHGCGRWAVVSKETQKLIGYGGLRNFSGKPELVYLLAKSYWGMGLATEIAKACLRWGFEERGFESIIAVTKPDNRASRRVMEKIGMSFDRDDKFQNMDVVFYSISRDAYQSIYVPVCERLADRRSRQRPEEDRISKVA
jgi:[ribosomal protein S5]-alanine N-acetyltransferase